MSSSSAPAASSASVPKRRSTSSKSSTQAEGLERYLHTKYVGQKRFSLEGGDSLIPLLDELVNRGGADGMNDIVLGMAHRGRLNVLVNMLGKSPREAVRRVRRQVRSSRRSGALGRREVSHGLLAPTCTTPGGTVHLALAFNPVASRDRRSGRRRLRPRAPGPSPRRETREHVAAGADPWRRGVRGPGRRHGDCCSCRRRAVSAPAARCTSSSTTRSASRSRIRATRARRCTAPTSRRCSRRRCST